MEGNPHQLIEGLIISAYAVEADKAYVFLRWEYRESAARVKVAIEEAYREGFLGRHIGGRAFDLDMRIHVGAGRYICGEETALLNALEGKRPIPRAKPPFPQTNGLWGRPTIVNNVETLSNIPHIVQNGPEWFKGLSRSADGGTKVYCVSGRVRNPGWWELPIGTSIGEVLDETGGMKDGFTVRAVIPGGASTEFVLPDKFDTPMDFDSMSRIAGSRLGTGTMIVLDDKTCPIGMVASLERFFARESCGWCTPCREGLPWIARTLTEIDEGEGRVGDLEILEEHVRLVRMGHTYCALAPGAMEPLASALKFFRDDFEQHVRDRKCKYREAAGGLASSENLRAGNTSH